MTQKEKTDCTRIALALSGICVNNKTVELIWRTVDGLNAKGDQFSVRDQVAIEVQVTGKVSKKKISS